MGKHKRKPQPQKRGSYFLRRSVKAAGYVKDVRKVKKLP